MDDVSGAMSPVGRVRRWLGGLPDRRRRLGRLSEFGRRVADLLEMAAAHRRAGTLGPALVRWRRRLAERAVHRLRTGSLGRSGIGRRVAAGLEREAAHRRADTLGSALVGWGRRLADSAMRRQKAKPRPMLFEAGKAPLTGSRQAGEARILLALTGRVALDHSTDLADEAIVDAATLMHDPDLPTILFLVHGRGGAAHARLRGLIGVLAGRTNALVLQGGADGGLRLLMAPRAGSAGLRFRVPDQISALVRLLHGMQVRRVDVHHVEGFEEQATEFLDALGLPFDTTLIDYHLFAREPHLCGPDGRFVGVAEALRQDGGMLRPEPSPIVHCADRVIAVSRDLAARVVRINPHLPLVTARPWTDASPDAPVIRPLREGEPLRIVVLGEFQTIGAGACILAVARLMAGRDLPVEIHVVGDVPIEAEVRDQDDRVLHRHGPVQPVDLRRALASIGPHLGWRPSQAPETWSRGLSDLMAARLPIAASAIGDVGERCAGRPATWLLPYETSAEGWVAFFETLVETGMDLPPRWAGLDDLPEAEDFYFDDYLAPLR